MDLLDLRRTVITIALSVFLLIVGCGSKEVKKETPEGRIASEAIAVSEGLREAYVNRNRAKIEQYTTPQVARSILQSLSSIDSAELSFTPAWIEIEEGKVTLNVSWKGKWTKGGMVDEDRGMAIFELKGQPLRVDKILRANPFEVR